MKKKVFLKRYRAHVTEGDGRDGSITIFTLPSVCVTGMLQVQFQALYLLLGVQPTHYRGGTSTHCVPHLKHMCLTLHMDGLVTHNTVIVTETGTLC